MSDNPYSSPSYAPVDKFAPQFNYNPHVYKPFSGLLMAIKVLAILTVVFSILVTIIELMGLANSSDIAAEALAETLTVYDMASGLLALVLIPLNLTWNILYLVATYRVTANSHALGKPRPETSPGFAVGCYFIPIFNLFKPYQVMKECYTACRANTGALLGLWWGTHIACAILSQVSTRLTVNAMRADSIEAASAMQNIALLLDVIGVPILLGLAFTSQQVLSRIAKAQADIASGKPMETGWTPAMMPPTKPISTWGGD